MSTSATSTNSPNPLALVTGACGGIGSEIARRLHRQGYRLLLVDQNAASLQSLAAALGGSAHIAVNLGVAAEVTVLQRQLLEQHSDVELAFINAGVIFPGDLVDMTPDHIDLQMSVNLVSAIHLIQTCAKMMRERGRGHIIATVSAGGVLAPQGQCRVLRVKVRPPWPAGSSAGRAACSRRVCVGTVIRRASIRKMLRHEAEAGGSALNFISQPQTVKKVGDAFFRALKRRKLELYVPYFDGLLARCLAFSPAWSAGCIRSSKNSASLDDESTCQGSPDLKALRVEK